jgi:hypothetical protein
LSSKYLLKHGQLLLHPSDFDLAAMRGIDIECHVPCIHSIQAYISDEASTPPSKAQGMSP